MNLRDLEAQAKMLAPVLKSFVEKSLAPILKRLEALELRQPEKGEQGEAGPQGEKGEKGEPGENGEPGQNGEPGERGEQGEAGNDGEAGSDGKDGKSITVEDVMPELKSHMESMKNAWALDFHKFAHAEFEKAVNKFPIPKDGKDGLGFDDMRIEREGKNFTMIWEGAGRAVEKTFSLPMMIYRGVYKQGNSYQKGDVCTFGGSIWHCDEDTNEKPGEGKCWTLAVKKGRDSR